MYALILCLSLMVNVSCWPSRDLRHFTLYGKTKGVNPTKLKINGVYYAIGKSYYPNREGKSIEGFILYENGTYLDLHSCEFDVDIKTSINSLISHFESRQQMYSWYIDHWGAFMIVGDTMLLQGFESWRMPKPGTIVYRSVVYDYKMRILNDSTLVGIYTNPPIKFSLFKTSHKPDSTNLFTTNSRIKEKLEKLSLKNKSDQ